jgi:hypothetical protein
MSESAKPVSNVLTLLVLLLVPLIAVVSWAWLTSPSAPSLPWGMLKVKCTLLPSKLTLTAAGSTHDHPILSSSFGHQASSIPSLYEQHIGILCPRCPHCAGNIPAYCAQHAPIVRATFRHIVPDMTSLCGQDDVNFISDLRIQAISHPLLRLLGALKNNSFYPLVKPFYPRLKVLHPERKRFYP